MPRSRRSAPAPARSAPSRPTVPANRPPPAGQQRSSSTAARSQAGQQQQQQGSGGSGLFGQMAATAGGVAVGSSIGHAIGSLFGGSSAQASEQDPALASSQQAYQTNPANNSNYAGGCDESAKAFTRCLDENKGEYQMSVCSYYLDQLKACQAAAKEY